MKVCFPVSEDRGIESEVYGHFGSAPLFIIVETSNNKISSVVNTNRYHEHGKCNPIQAIEWHDVDSVITGGIGSGAIVKLGMHGIVVYRAEARTIAENLELLIAEKLKQYTPSQVCPGHGNKQGCSH